MSSGALAVSTKLKTGLSFLNGGSQARLLLFPSQQNLSVFHNEWLISPLKGGAAVHMLSTSLVPVWFYL